MGASFTNVYIMLNDSVFVDNDIVAVRDRRQLLLPLNFGLSKDCLKIFCCPKIFV